MFWLIVLTESKCRSRNKYEGKYVLAPAQRAGAHTHTRRPPTSTQLLGSTALSITLHYDSPLCSNTNIVICHYRNKYERKYIIAPAQLRGGAPSFTVPDNYWEVRQGRRIRDQRFQHEIAAREKEEVLFLSIGVGMNYECNVPSSNATESTTDSLGSE